MTDDGQEMAEGSGDNVEKKDGETAAPAAAAGHLNIKILRLIYTVSTQDLV